jgi:hypothetical protein
MALGFPAPSFGDHLRPRFLETLFRPGGKPEPAVADVFELVARGLLFQGKNFCTLSRFKAIHINGIEMPVVTPTITETQIVIRVGFESGKRRTLGKGSLTNDGEDVFRRVQDSALGVWK